MTKKKIAVEPTSEARTEEPKQDEEAPEAHDEETEAVKEAPQTQTQTKKAKMITCQLCNKTMLEKTFKYYHHIKCRPNVQTENMNHLVEFDFSRKVAGKTNRFGDLFSKAV